MDALFRILIFIIGVLALLVCGLIIAVWSLWQSLQEHLRILYPEVPRDATGRPFKERY